MDGSVGSFFLGDVLVLRANEYGIQWIFIPRYRTIVWELSSIFEDDEFHFITLVQKQCLVSLKFGVSFRARSYTEYGVPYGASL